MENTERTDFIAERPHIDGCDIIMPWPATELFETLRNERCGYEERQDENDWYFDNQLYGVKDEYFRMRYRGAEWPWNTFNPSEQLSEDPDTRLRQFLSKSYWAPATNTALDMYEKTHQKQYKTAAAFACGLHIVDALNHGWAFLDPSLKNDSGVREKHYLIFLETVAEVDLLDLDDVEREYFDKLKTQLHLAYAEIAAQNPISAARDLMMFDGDFRVSHEVEPDETRSSLISFANAPDELKVRIVERFKKSAIDGMQEEFGGDPVFRMEALHLFGLADMAKFYPEDYDQDAPWWLLSAEEILVGDTTNMYPASTKAREEYTQDNLF